MVEEGLSKAEGVRDLRPKPSVDPLRVLALIGAFGGETL